jgi:hypothetical protein
MQNLFIKWKGLSWSRKDCQLNLILCRKPQQTDFEHCASFLFKRVQAPLRLFTLQSIDSQ